MNARDLFDVSAGTSLAELSESFGIRDKPIDSPIRRLHAWALVAIGGSINLVHVDGVNYSWDARPRQLKNGAVAGRVHAHRRGELSRDIGGYKIDARGRVVQLPAELRQVLPGGLEAEISTDVGESVP